MGLFDRLRQGLTKSRENFVNNVISVFDTYQYINDDFYDELAKRAFSLKIGARGIAKALQKVLTSIHIQDIEPEDVQKIVFTGEVLSDPSKIILIPREKEKQKVKEK